MVYPLPGVIVELMAPTEPIIKSPLCVVVMLELVGVVLFPVADDPVLGPAPTSTGPTPENSAPIKRVN